MVAQATEGAVHVRHPTRRDAQRLAELATQLGYASTPEEVAARLAAIEKDSGHAVFVAENSRGEVHGFVHVFVMRTVESDPHTEIGGLVVNERCLSRGIGRALLKQAENWAREHGCEAIGLRSNIIRERAHVFYERLGYQHIKTQKAFRKTL